MKRDGKHCLTLGFGFGYTTRILCRYYLEAFQRLENDTKIRYTKNDTHPVGLGKNSPSLIYLV